MNKIWLILSILALAALSPAPIISESAKGHDIPTHSQEQYNKEQGLNGTQGVVGYVPSKTDESGFEVEATRSNSSAQSDVAAAGQDITAAQNLKVVDAELKSKTGPSLTSWLMPLMFVSVGFFGVFGFRKWIDKQVPMPRERRKAQW